MSFRTTLANSQIVEVQHSRLISIGVSLFQCNQAVVVYLLGAVDATLSKFYVALSWSGLTRSLHAEGRFLLQEISSETGRYGPTVAHVPP